MYCTMANVQRVIVLMLVASQGHVGDRDHSGSVPRKPRRFFWMDYFTLRQRQPDFIPSVIVEVIKDIGMTAVSLTSGKGIGNIDRSFCVLELYATVAGKCKFVVYQTITNYKNLMRLYLGQDKAAVPAKMRQNWMGPVDTENARTRNSNDKLLVDEFVRSIEGSFSKVNKVVSDAVIASCPYD